MCDATNSEEAVMANIFWFLVGSAGALYWTIVLFSL